MKILYLHADASDNSPEPNLHSRGDDVTFVANSHEALTKIAGESFDAVVVAQDGPEILEFTRNAHRIRPFVPVFVASVWGPVDLPVALASVRDACHPMCT